MQDIIRLAYCEATDSVLICAKKAGESYQFYTYSLVGGQLECLTDQENGLFLAFMNNAGNKLYFFEDVMGNERGRWMEKDLTSMEVKELSISQKPYCSYEFTIGKKNDQIAYSWFTRDENSGIMMYDQLETDSSLCEEIYLAKDEEVEFPVVSDFGNFMAFCSEQKLGKKITLWNYQKKGFLEIGDFASDKALELLFFEGERKLFFLKETELFEYEIDTGKLNSVFNFKAEVQFLGNFGNKTIFSHDVSGKNKVMLLELSNNAFREIEIGNLNNSFYQMFYRKKADSLLFLGSTINSATDLYELRMNGELSCLNMNSEEKSNFNTAEIHFLNSHSDQEIQGWLFSDTSVKRPVIINLHGGPHAFSGNGYSIVTNWLLKQNYDVLELNYSGSTTFGEKFKQLIYGNPGENECLDIFHAYHFLINEKGYSPDQIYLQGDSYGGYLALLFAGKFPGLCKKIVSVVGIGDLEECYKDFPDQLKALFTRLFGGTPREKVELYSKANPINYLPELKDEVLIIHGTNDARCPAKQMQNYIDAANNLNKHVTAVWFKGGHLDLLSSESNLQIYLQNVKKLFSA